MDYPTARNEFKWTIPERFNIGVDVCDRWADIDANRVAIIQASDDTEVGIRRFTFGELRTTSNQLAHRLTKLGLVRGDRIAVFAPQRYETAAAHLAIYKLGAIAVPLFALFGAQALLHRLRDSGARAVIADADGARKLAELRADLPDLVHVIALDGDDGSEALLASLASEEKVFEAVDTASEDPALIIYTSGTTGSSKGALLPHRVLFGHLPGVEMSHGGFPEPGDCMWTPADWAWIGGLLDVLLPSLHHGIPVVAKRFAKFDAERAFELMARCGVRNTFLPPTALKMLRAHGTPQQELVLRSVASGGESLGEELLDWGKKVLGVSINEFYGQTECNMVVSSCGTWFEAKPGKIGKAVPGHDVAIIDDDGNVLGPELEGEIAVRSPDPVMFLGYWNLPDATTTKFVGPWLKTGDRGSIDADGFIRFLGRNDDVITSAGYRIGPGEIEDCLLGHPAVQAAGVVGIPDPERTEVVGAFVVLRAGLVGDAALAAALQQHVRVKLGAHQYPRRVFFLDTLPLTATGKIVRRELRALATSR